MGLICRAVQVRKHAIAQLVDRKERFLRLFRETPGLTRCRLSVASAERGHQAHLHGADVFLVGRNAAISFVITVVEAADVEAPERNAAHSHAESAIQDGRQIVQRSRGITCPVCRVVLASCISASSPEQCLFSHFRLGLCGCLVNGASIQQGEFVVRLQSGGAIPENGILRNFLREIGLDDANAHLHQALYALSHIGNSFRICEVDGGNANAAHISFSGREDIRLAVRSLYQEASFLHHKILLRHLAMLNRMYIREHPE